MDKKVYEVTAIEGELTEEDLKQVAGGNTYIVSNSCSATGNRSYQYPQRALVKVA